MRRRRTLAAALAMTMVVAACTADQDKTDETPGVSAQTSLPGDDVSILTGEDAGGLALDVSQALYDLAPVVLLVDADDIDRQRQSEQTVAELGVPMLLTPPSDDTAGTGAVARELARLETTTVLTTGDAAADWAQALDPAVDVVPTEASTGATDAVGAAGDAPTAPAVTPSEPLPGLAVLTSGAPHTIAAAATARATGAQVLVTAANDPRTDPAVISALAARPPTHTLALGEDFGPAESLRGRLAVAATGVELPGGGQTVYPGRLLVALYGHPGATVLGALGEQPMAEAIARAQQVAADYEDLVDVPVVPTLEIITTVASASAGPAGDYSRRTPVADLEPWIEAAREAGVYVVLDLQPGHTDFLTQAKEYEQLLLQPHVGLALDPEWRLGPDQQHMVNIGSVDAAEVNEVVEWLADLTAAHTLPQKLLILHQFTLRMITNRSAVDTGRDGVAVLIHADGFGTPAQKVATWNALRADRPEGAWWGWKNFYDEDRPMLTPAETIAIDPSPRFISYQ